jgi:glycosyltransferase involved in cell wall biosynthesis
MTRVLHLLAGGAAGGAETYCTETLVALAAAGVEQWIVTRPHPQREALLRQAGIKVITAPFGRWFDWRTRRAIRRAVAEFQPQIVQAWMGRAASFLPGGAATNIGWFGGYYDLKRYRRADHFVGCTEDIARSIRARGMPEDRVHTIHTFADLDDLPAVARASLSTPEGVPLLLFLGRLHEKKGVDLALAALAVLPGCWLWIAGEGLLRGELEALTHRLGVADRVRWLGWRTDRGALLRAADLLLVPSRYEPFGTIMVEAWATGTPLIAAAAAGPAAYVKDGENGLLVPIDDSGALVKAVEQVLRDGELRRRLTKGGRKTYEVGFTKQKIVEAWLDLYRSVD